MERSVWQMDERYEADVIESLENSFGELEDKSTLADALISAAKNAVEDKMADYLQDLLQSYEGGDFERLDNNIVEINYRTALQYSVVYMLLTRCGINADDYFQFEDFQHLIDFSTPQTAGALGLATSDIAENCLREIPVTVISLEKERAAGNWVQRHAGRTFAKPETPAHNVPITEIKGGPEHDRNVDISDGGRLPAPESGAINTNSIITRLKRA